MTAEHPLATSGGNCHLNHSTSSVFDYRADGGDIGIEGRLKQEISPLRRDFRQSTRLSVIATAVGVLAIRVKSPAVICRIDEIEHLIFIDGKDPFIPRNKAENSDLICNRLRQKESVRRDLFDGPIDAIPSHVRARQRELMGKAGRAESDDPIRAMMPGYIPICPRPRRRFERLKTGFDFLVSLSLCANFSATLCSDAAGGEEYSDEKSPVNRGSHAAAEALA